jgi:Tol biopolymer transport system component
MPNILKNRLLASILTLISCLLFAAIGCSSEIRTSGIAFTIETPTGLAIAVVDTDGANQVILTDNDDTVDAQPNWSPDGNLIVFHSNRDGDYEIYTMKTNGTGTTKLTDNTGTDILPVWSPDDSKIAFTSQRDDTYGIYVMNADGSDQMRITPSDVSSYAPKWSPDGSMITFHSDRDGNLEIYTMNADGSDQTRITNDDGTDIFPDWSPDASQIIFQSDRDGLHDIYAINIDGTGLTQLTDTHADSETPVWSPDGSQILFVERSRYSTSVVVYDVASGEITAAIASGFAPCWSPNIPATSVPAD